MNTYLDFFFSGFLGKSVLDLSKAVTDLLVRQKQVTVGMPPHNEVIVSGGVALKSKDLICTIHSAFKGMFTMCWKAFWHIFAIFGYFLAFFKDFWQLLGKVIVSGGVGLKSKDLICTIHSAFKGMFTMCWKAFWYISAIFGYFLAFFNDVWQLLGKVIVFQVAWCSNQRTWSVPLIFCAFSVHNVLKSFWYFFDI